MLYLLLHIAQEIGFCKLAIKILKERIDRLQIKYYDKMVRCIERENYVRKAEYYEKINISSFSTSMWKDFYF